MPKTAALFFGIFLFTTAAFAAETNTNIPASTVKVLNTDYQARTETNTVSDLTRLSDGLFEAPQSRQFVHKGTTLISSKISIPEEDKELTLDLGRFESQIILKSLKRGNYPVEITMTVELPDTRRKSVSVMTQVTPSELKPLDPDFIRDFGIRFADILEEEYQDFEKEYGGNFREALQGYATSYVEMVLSTFPKVITQLVDKAKRQATSKTVDRDSASQPHKILKLRQEDFRRNESLEIDHVEMEGISEDLPESKSDASFILSVEDEKNQESIPAAKVHFSIGVTELPAGSYRSTFQWNLRYKDKEPLEFAYVLTHESDLSASDLYRKLKKDWLDPSFAQFQSSAETPEEQLFRKFFLDEMEIYLQDQIAYFPAFFSRSQSILTEANAHLQASGPQVQAPEEPIMSYANAAPGTVPTNSTSKVPETDQ